MLPSLAQLSLALALIIAFITSLKSFRGKGQVGALTWLVTTQFCLISFAFFTLFYLFFQNDFSVYYVAAHSHSTLPWFYRLCAVWGAHEGSMLLWLWVLSLWACLLAHFSKRLDGLIREYALGVLSCLIIGFLLFIIITSNPFWQQFPTPLDGADLNPLLQDIGMISHPPMLYMGYVGFAVVFALAIAALLRGEVDREWAKWCRLWALLAWSFLTLGITLGSWWAYRELGWGGFWFWDPVENASFMPWLVGTALVHSLIMTAGKSIFQAWTVLLAILTFTLSLIGTFLVRSGVITSVHAFASDPTRGAFMLAFILVVVGSALTIYAMRSSQLQTQTDASFFSKEKFFLLNNMLLIVMMLTVLLGTVYPLITAVLGLSDLSVGSPYFNTVLAPLAFILFALMGFAPQLKWQHTDMVRHKKQLLILACVSVIVTVGIIVTYRIKDVRAVIAMLLLVWLAISTSQSLWQRWKNRSHYTRHAWLRGYAMTFAHLGLAFSFMGIVMSAVLSDERQVVMPVGSAIELGGYNFSLEKVSTAPGSNYDADIGIFRVRRGKHEWSLTAEKRLYRASEMVMTEAGVQSSWFQDIYVALGQAVDESTWSVRLYIKPFIRWIWLGGCLMFLSGLFSLALQIGRRWREAD